MSPFTNNNPFMNSSMMDMWNKNMEMCKKSMESMNFPSFNQKNQNFDPSNYMSEVMQNVKDMVSNSNKNFDSMFAIWRRKAEIMQKLGSEMMEFMKSLSSVTKPEEMMAKQSSFMKELHQNVMADYKELCEMYSKSNFEAFENASSKFSDGLKKSQDSFNNIKAEVKKATK